MSTASRATRRLSRDLDTPPVQSRKDRLEKKTCQEVFHLIQVDHNEEAKVFKKIDVLEKYINLMDVTNAPPEQLSVAREKLLRLYES